MANLERLINEAQFAYSSITPGGTDEQKFRARAKRIATRIASTAPNSPEATQARVILYQLGVAEAMPLQTPPNHTDHMPESPHKHDFSAKRTAAALPLDTAQLVEKYKALPAGARTILQLALIAALVFFTVPLFVVAVGLLILRPKLVRDQLKKVFGKHAANRRNP